jgi:hypothetical protein
MVDITPPNVTGIDPFEERHDHRMKDRIRFDQIGDDHGVEQNHITATGWRHLFVPLVARLIELSFKTLQDMPVFPAEREQGL